MAFDASIEAEMTRMKERDTRYRQTSRFIETKRWDASLGVQSTASIWAHPLRNGAYELIVSEKRETPGKRARTTTTCLHLSADQIMTLCDAFVTKLHLDGKLQNDDAN